MNSVRLSFILGFFVLFTLSSSSEEEQWKGPVPKVQAIFGSIPETFKKYDVILKPDRDEPEWWAGGPSVVRDAQGIFWMACRMRTAEAQYGQRGYEIRIFKSPDGIHFEQCHRIRREDVPIPGFERPCLMIDPHTQLFKLYGCGPWKGEAWSIIKWDDATDPTLFVPSTAKPVIQPLEAQYPRDIRPSGYKDPVILYAEGKYHAYLIGQIRGLEKTYYFTSQNGETWTPEGNPHYSLMDLNGWHDFFVRPASVLPLGIGYLFIYEGSNSQWYDPVYNVTTGLGFTFDLKRIIDLTPESPLFVSTTPNSHFSTWRYSHWMQVEEEIWIYAEVACENGTNEVRLYRVRK